MKKGESETVTLHSAADLAQAMLGLADLKPSEDNPITLMVSMDDQSRSQKQNRLAFMWYKLRAMMTGHGIHYERHYCKLTYGVPILFLADKDFSLFCQKTLFCLTYEQKLDSMEFIPVTSLMGMKQFAEYLNEIDQQSAAEGIVLPKPEELYWDALMKEATR